MPKTILLIFISYSIITAVNSQITKGNWLVGGSASFSSLKSSSTAAAQFKQTNFQINPLIGYFIIDKFVTGLRPSFIYGSNNAGNSNTIIGIGPFTRYYFLKPERLVNLFTEASYSYGIIYGKRQVSSRSNTFSISGGPVVYFNSSVGLEFIVAYSTAKAVHFAGANNELKFGIGFQFHLEREK